MDGKILARVGAVVFVAFAITATVIELSRKDEPPVYRSLAATTETGIDPLKIELRRCQQLGEAGTRDPACLQAWADNRDRFLKPSQALQPQPAPLAPGPQGQPQNPPPARDPAVNETAPTIDSHTNEAR
ncbi:putative entry exclusion protein TrbK-alt [Nitrospirillum sp. BR 11164]|uniref:putative entry exclusion protein TrbK-alt n=1 Tax=Nitrospirillum sp. BR 11164 TaxID=3104324 RepID=UPI002AFFF60C|nr:putative entry exclusion protein TrbK-alt [Nitrospirillum sp. BR 11164]MEA1651279.1 putative entry exclusion protein TrbK-alt [Nitrospirillum sp. BR 11164]